MCSIAPYSKLFPSLNTAQFITTHHCASAKSNLKSSRIFFFSPRNTFFREIENMWLMKASRKSLPILSIIQRASVSACWKPRLSKHSCDLSVQEGAHAASQHKALLLGARASLRCLRSLKGQHRCETRPMVTTCKVISNATGFPNAEEQCLCCYMLLYFKKLSQNLSD